MTTETIKPRGYIPALDGMRAIAVLLVMWQHIPIGKEQVSLEAWQRVIQPGYLGVDIFFVLSGFLITRILLVDKERGLPLRYFLMRRVLRIFPIYYLTLLVIWIVRGGPELGWCAVYLSNFWLPYHEIASPLRHTWSLAVEEHYYLLWPLAVYLLSRRGSLLLASAVLIPGSIAAAFIANHYLVPEYRAEDVAFARQLIQVGTMYRVLSLSAGALLAFYEPFLRKHAWRTFLIALIVGTAGYWSVWMAGFRPLFGSRKWVWLPAVWLVGFAAVSTGWILIGLAIDRLGHGAQHLLSNPPMRFIGRISYGLYLYHFPIYFALDMWRHDGGGHPPLTEVVTAVGLTFLTATASFYLLERPILRLQSRFRSKPPAG